MVRRGFTVGSLQSSPAGGTHLWRDFSERATKSCPDPTSATHMVGRRCPRRAAATGETLRGDEQQRRGAFTKGHLSPKIETATLVEEPATPRPGRTLHRLGAALGAAARSGPSRPLRGAHGARRASGLAPLGRWWPAASLRAFRCRRRRRSLVRAAVNTPCPGLFFVWGCDGAARAMLAERDTAFTCSSRFGLSRIRTT